MIVRDHSARLARMALLGGTALSIALASSTAFAQSSQSTPPVTIGDPAADTAAEQDVDTAAPADDAGQDIVVTGTLIRGVTQPTGAALVNVGRDTIVSTGVTAAKDLLNQTVPQLSSFNALPSGSADFGSAVTKISLRGIGSATGLASGTNATLVLINGHRVVPVGILSTDADPDLIPSDILETVQVLPDGGSATYGSDAIGGVVNFVTRKQIDGLQLRGQHIFGDDYHENTVTGVFGKSWSTGSAFISGTYNEHDAIFGRDRDYITTDFRRYGGQDTRRTSCEYGTFTVNGQLYSGNGLAPIGAAPRCDATDNTSLVPEEERYNVFGYVEQELGDNLKFSMDALWSRRSSKIYSDIANITGSYVITPANPFFRPVGGSTRQTVALNYGRAIGVNRVSPQVYSQYQFAPSLVWTANDNWQVRTDFLYGRSISKVHDRTGVNGAALTSTNFNPYDPAQTDAAVRSALADYELYSRGVNTITSGTLVANGTLFQLPGGDVKLAFGGEIRRQTLDNQTVTGPIGDRTGLRSFDSKRTIKAAFAELFVPIVGEGNSMPGIYALSLNGAVRHDHYSDFGSTTNPRIAIDYRPVRDLLLRANYQTTFVAPSLADSGNQIDTRLQIQTLATNVYQIFIAGAGQNLDPQEGRTYSIGADWTPEAVPNLRASVTYWNTKVDKLISQALTAFGGSTGASATAYNLCGVGYAPQQKSASANGACTADYLNSIQNLWLRIDNGAAPSVRSIADLVAPGVIVADVIDARRNNFGTAKLSGIDASISYSSDVSFGRLFGSIAATYNLKRDISSRQGGPFIDYLDGEVVVGSPRYNAVVSFGGVSGPVTVRANVRRSGGYDIPVNNAPPQRRVGSYTVADIYAGIELGDFTQLENTRLDLTVANLFDQDPPFYLGAMNANRPAGYANGATLGRTINLGLTTKF